MVIDVSAEFFQTLEVNPPPTKIANVEYDEKLGMHVAHLIWLGPTEPFLQKIRRWLYSHRSGYRNAA